MNRLSARARTGGDAHPWYTAVLGLYLALALVLGGASQDNDGFDLVLRLAGLPLLALSALRLLAREDVSRPALLFLGSLILLPLVQLIPLPPAVWSALPGRAAGSPLPRAVPTTRSGTNSGAWRKTPDLHHGPPGKPGRAARARGRGRPRRVPGFVPGSLPVKAPPPPAIRLLWRRPPPP